MARKPKRKKGKRKHPQSAKPAASRPRAARDAKKKAAAPLAKKKGTASPVKKKGTASLVWVSVIVVSVIVLLFGIYYFSGASENKARDVPSLGNLHITKGTSHTITYNTDPPTSGPHYPRLTHWGVHSVPIDKGFQVHNLEDGGVLVQYNCMDCPELVQKLGKIVRGYSKEVILAPYPPMKHRIALTAWGKIDTFDTFDAKRITGFINAFRGLDHHPRR